MYIRQAQLVQLYRAIHIVFSSVRKPVSCLLLAVRDSGEIVIKGLCSSKYRVFVVGVN